MLGRYTTGPFAASAEDSRPASRCRPIRPIGRRARKRRSSIGSGFQGPGDRGGGSIVLYSPPMSVIDLRSDTVTHPTEEMRRAMAAADVGDDVFGEDPTVNALEERAAELLGKEAGLFVSSGTMGNLVSLMAHVPRGGELIAGAQSHIARDEAAGHAVVVGASVLQLRDRADGSLDTAEIAAAFRD